MGLGSEETVSMVIDPVELDFLKVVSVVTGSVVSVGLVSELFSDSSSNVGASRMLRNPNEDLIPFPYGLHGDVNNRYQSEQEKLYICKNVWSTSIVSYLLTPLNCDSNCIRHKLSKVRVFPLE